MTTDILPFHPTDATLANGLRVIIVPTGFPNLVSVQIPVQAGSRNEVEPGKSGFAHFFEHIMFRGTARFPASAYQDIITRAGARQNAYTTDDYTNYHVTFAREDLETILDLEADRFMNLAYSEEDFKTEARAILGEYNKSSADPINKLIEVQRDHAFTTHTYKHTTMGFLADIEDMPNQGDYSRLFFDRWYRPEYTAVIVAGDVDGPDAVRLVEKYWGAWKPGGYRVDVPAEPARRGPVVAHVEWDSPTLPWLSIAFHGPAFSDTNPDFAALDLLFDLTFGETSDLYRQLVEEQQTVDQFFGYAPAHTDPSLASILGRVKRLEDLPAIRDQVFDAVARVRREPVAAQRLADAKSNARYGFARTLDNSESIAGTLARYVRFDRSYDTLNRLFRTYDAVTPDDLHRVATTYLAEDRMVVTTLASDPLPTAMGSPPSFAAAAPAPAPAIEVVLQPSELSLLRFKLLFVAGSAHDPAGKEGLAALAAEMIAGAGSEERRIDEINRALFPIAGSFDSQVDREMTVFTGVVHRDNAERLADIVLPQLLRPGFRDDDFARLKAQQHNHLVQDLRANNDEELGKERLQANLFAGTPYGHPTVGTVAGIDAITLDDVRDFATARYTRANLTLGIAGDVPEAFLARLRRALAALPAGEKAAAAAVSAHQPDGLEVEIVAKETRATAISFGHPIDVTRSHPDFAALSVARSWLGEHRASQGRLFQRLREVRGLNYGNYAYIEAFPRGMYQFSPDANLARRAQIFEVWIRPVVPENAVMALRIGLHELDRMIEDGLNAQDFEDTRNYLAKGVFLLTKTQDAQLGYALDSRWYGTGEFTSTFRDQLAKLSREEVNSAIRHHLSARDLSIVIVTRDAEGLRQQLLSGAPTTLTYDADKPPELLAEDRLIGARALNLRPDSVRITPSEDVFAR